VFNDLISYFEGTEEYEKCAELLYSRNLINNLSLQKK
jgi:hypothetical protein